jgi:hypothetical protein
MPGEVPQSPWRAPRLHPSRCRKQKPQESKPQEPRPANPTPEVKPPKAETQQPVPKQQAKPDKEQPNKDKKQSKEERKEQKQTAGKGARIPDRDFKAHFGKAHTFKAQQVITTTAIVPHETRFMYSGYTFMFVDPWPAGWLLTDDCYIDDLDGEYFLLDPFHPGIQVALIVVLWAT